MAQEERNVPFSPRLDEGAVGSHEGVARREGLLVGSGGWENRSRRRNRRGRCNLSGGPKLSSCFSPCGRVVSRGRGGRDQMAERAALVVALSSHLTKLSVVVAQWRGRGWSRGVTSGVPDARDPVEARDGPGGFHDAIGISGHLIEVGIGGAGEDLADFGGELGQKEGM